MERLENESSVIPLLALSLEALAYPIGDEGRIMTECTDEGLFR